MKTRKLLIMLVTSLILFGAPAWVQAATITVNDTGDTAANDGVCTLREAITAANSDTISGAAIGECAAGIGTDTIDLTGVGGTITLTGALDTITESVTLTGPGAGSLTVDANGGVTGARVFTIDSPGNNQAINISGLTISGGDPAASGGGIYLGSGDTLNLSNSVVSANEANQDASGGGIYNNNGTLTITNSTIENNSAGLNPSGNGSGGGIASLSGSLSLFNSTVNDNVTSGLAGGGQGQRSGGGIFVGGSGTAAIKNSTISNNESYVGGGIYSNTGVASLAIVNTTITQNSATFSGGLHSDGSTTSLTNTIIAENTGGPTYPNCGGGVGITSNGGNLIGDDSDCSYTPGTGDQVGDSANPVDPELAALADNGGPTNTHALLAASPAIDAGNDTPVCAGADTDINNEDQRGETRCVDVYGNGSTIDIGAYEVQVFMVDSTSDVTDAMEGNGLCDDGAGNCTLRAAIQEANSLSGTDAIHIPAATYTLSIAGTLENNSATGDLDVLDDLVMVGDDASTTIIDGGALDGVLSLNPAGMGLDITTEVVGLTVQNGAYAGVDYGGGTHTLRQCVIQGNVSSNNGAGVYVSTDTIVNIDRCAIINNQATGFHGGGLYATGLNTTVTVTNSTISGNQTVDYGGGIMMAGGTVLNLNNVTITNNTADSDTDDDGEGGGIAFTGSDVVTIKNSLIAGNHDDSVGGTPTIRPDCSGGVALTSGGYNLIGDETGCSGFSVGSNDLVGTSGSPIDPLISALGSNGGTSPTHRLLDGSPAIDAANPSGCDDENDDPLATDQRGFTRTDNGRCDMGAYEFGICGDTVVDPGEECDNGGSNSDTTANACRTTCVNFSCGDGVVDSGEGCDDGNNTDGDGCQANCALPTCGDGIIDSGEACDDGGSNSGSVADACRTTCAAASCGDGVVDNGEACDDGNADNTDSCLNSCVDATCGDGAIQANVEDCDDGNTDNGDGCSSLCLSELSEGTSNDLQGANPDVDFNSLIISNTYNLNAPDPTVGSSLVLAQTIPESCTCDWSISDELLGAFNPTNACQTALAILLQGSGQIALTVDCGNEGASTYVQDITATGVSGTAGAGSSGGCSLIRGKTTLK